MKRNNITVTKPYLPSLEEFIPYLEKIWKSKWLTNNGPFHQQFEEELCSHLGVEYISLFSNGTIALVTALQALRVTGEVITTPYSFVATTHALFWNNIEPVFVDIDPLTMNMSADGIEAAITPRTSAIMPVHCYGHPCDVDRIQKIADIYGLKVIYDAAHSFDVRYKGQSILTYGDLSVLSFHATKVFNTFEGGAIVCSDFKAKQRIDYLKNFGIADEVTVVAPGINGKMNEVQAAFGLLQLKHINQAIHLRRKVDDCYRKALANVKGITIPLLPQDTNYNYAYFPILVEANFPISRDQLYDMYLEEGIHVRRYFYPLISDLPMYRGLSSASSGRLAVAKSISERILCLPIYPDLNSAQQAQVVNVLTRNL